MENNEQKINYVIASWSGARNGNSNVAYYENVLKNHLKILDETPNRISQITIMKPINDIQNSYYDIVLTDKIKLVENVNKYQSYGQWLKAVELFLDDFDYFVFVEDDYVPGTPNFDQKLLDIYQEGTYLGASVNMPDNVGHFLAHLSISNGFISKKTIENVILQVNYDDWFQKYHALYPKRTQFGGNFQICFSRYLQENDINLSDYSFHYAADFFSNDGNLYECGRNPNPKVDKIFTAIQSVIHE